MDLNISLATKNPKQIRPLYIYIYIYLAKKSAYRRDFDETRYMSFLIKNDKLIENYNESSKQSQKRI